MGAGISGGKSGERKKKRRKGLKQEKQSHVDTRAVNNQETNRKPAHAADMV